MDKDDRQFEFLHLDIDELKVLERIIYHQILKNTSVTLRRKHNGFVEKTKNVPSGKYAQYHDFAKTIKKIKVSPLSA